MSITLDLTQQINKIQMKTIKITPNTDVSGSVKDGVAMYCKCGMIIYAATNEAYKDKETKKEIDRYWDLGYSMGRVSKQEVQEKFGCKCAK